LAAHSGKQMKQHTFRLVWLAVSGFLILAGLYILLLAFAPSLSFIPSSSTTKVSASADSVSIPDVGIKEQIYEDGPASLDKGAWHRYPARGNPEKGGNFILSAHRYGFSLNPAKVKADSRFYRIEDVQKGDTIQVTWNDKDYTYTVTEVKKVKPDAVDIEAPSQEPKLTLYSCTLAGRYDGRVVVIARPDFTQEIKNDVRD